ncbi:MAG: hypothetical protein JWQ66_995 [Mucilaginibacter sp.]|nr:hypothetical protein [Mucilaginibacter sp.]
MKKFLLIVFLIPALLSKGQSVKSSSKFIFKNGASSTGWMNFDFYNDNRIFVPAKINGQETIITLANGVATSGIDKDFAASIGLRPMADVTPESAVAVQVQFGNLTIMDINASPINLAPFAKIIGHPVSFVLGDDLFNQLAVDIDFAHHRIAFRNPASLAIPAGAAKVPLIKTLDHRTVPASVEGAPQAQFELGLGNAAPLLLYQAFYQVHKLLENRPTSLRQGGGGAGPFPIEPVATMSRARFAGIDFLRLPAAFIPDTIRGSDSDLIAGNIGINVLARFRLIVDYPHDMLYAVPYARAANIPFVKDRLGMIFIKRDSSLEVKFVSPGSPAQAAGFKTNDRITLINQKPVQALRESWLANLRFTIKGTIFTFTMDDGSVRRVTATDFF